MREGAIWDIDELIDFTLTYWGVLLNWFQLLMNYWLKSNVILKNLLIKFVFLSLYINIEKNIQTNNIKSPKMLTLRFFFPLVFIQKTAYIFAFVDANLIKIRQELTSR